MVDYLLGVMLTALEMLCCRIFFESFHKRRSENRWRNYGIILGLILMVYFTAIMFYNQFLLKQILIILIMATAMFIYVRIHFAKSLILVLLFQGLLLSIDYFALWASVSLFDSIARMDEQQPVGGYLAAILAKVLLFMVILVIRKKFGKKSSEVLTDTEWLQFIFFPVFTIFTIVGMIVTSGGIREQSQENVFLAVAFCLAGMNIAVFYWLDNVLKQEAKLRESRLFEIRVKNQTEMYRSISESFEKQRRMLHEYKNQIMCMESLLATKNYEELESYVTKVNGKLGTEMGYIKTNNVIVDAVLNCKYQEMLNKKILLVMKINDLSELNISDEDIVVILSNLLNNAIEACEKCSDKKVIKMKLMKENHSLIISVKNTYNGLLVIKDGEIQTSKKQEMDEHGIGIKNILDVIAKYEGSYVIQNDEKEFYFSMIMPCKSKGVNITC